MNVVYRGFDGLDVAFQGALPRDLVDILEAAKARASETMAPDLVSYGKATMHVAETGARGGYAFRCDTGPDGATWLLKRGSNPADWNIRVSVKSMPLALYGLGGVRARLYEFLDNIGVKTTAQGVSIGRVDYAVDVLDPNFELVPDLFVMHSHSNRQDHLEPEPVKINGRSSRVTSVTVGKMPGRQVIVYDKRAEVIERQKVHWWEIWNGILEKQGMAELDRKDRFASPVWRVELRAGKKHLKDRWGIVTWSDLDNKIGDLFKAALQAVRYTCPRQDTNRARWADHPLWDTVTREVSGDLFEMMSGAEPGVVKEVCREHLGQTLDAQITGLSATLAVVRGVPSDQAADIPGLIADGIMNFIKAEPAIYERKMERAGERYIFINEQDTNSGRPRSVESPNPFPVP